MLDEFSKPSAFDGDWDGFYDHDNKRDSTKNFPINATIQTDGTTLRGIMIDGVTEFVRSYRALIEAYDGDLPIGVLHQAEWILHHFPDYQIESSLPEESRLEGKISDLEVKFVKTYLGDCLCYGNNGSARMLIRRDRRHRVRYEGRLNPGHDTIEGRWIIDGPGFWGRFFKPRGTGRFQLFKRK